MPSLVAKPKLDVVLIATLRPEIIRITLASFWSKLLRQYDVRLILNVDPIGEEGCTQEDVVSLCRARFPNVVSRCPEEPSFSVAVQWAWQQVETAVFFHLEDDWCLKRTVLAESVSRVFEDSAIVGIRLNLTNNAKFPFDKHVINSGFSLNPSFYRRTYISELLDVFDVTKDPEKQFSRHQSTKSFSAPKFVYYGGRKDSALVIDTGKKWRRHEGLSKWNLADGKASVAWSRSGRAGALKAFQLYLKYRFFLAWWRLLYCGCFTER